MREKIVSFVLVTMLTLGMSITAHAAQDVPVIDDTKDFSTTGAPNFTYVDGYVIQSYDLTSEEIYMGQALQELHTHPTQSRHFNVTSHSHSITDIVEESPLYYVWYPTTMWTRNSIYKNSADWPTVSWETSVSTTASASVSTTVGVTDSVVSSSLGAEFTKSHTISTAFTRTFKVPYKKDGRIKVNFYRPYRTFTCVTTYYFAGPPLVQWDDTGSGSAIGAPYDLVCDLETQNY